MSHEDRDAAELREVHCEDLSSFFVDYVDGNLPRRAAASVRRHLAGCAACRAEVESLGAVWHALERLEEEEPSAVLRARFETMLEADQEGRSSERSWVEGFASWLGTWWPTRPLRQLAISAAALVLGLVLGSRLTAPNGEMATLRSEVESLHRLVGLSLLQQESASARLQGVSYTRRTAADEELMAALLDVLNEDENTSVRLAAIDALARFAKRRSVLEKLRASLPKQSSPLVQLSLVDLLLELDGPESQRAVRELLERDDLDATVRGHLAERLASPEV